MKRLFLVIGLLALFISSVTAQTDLSGLVIVIDPGHGGHEGDDRHIVPVPGIDFWESESNFYKALHLKALLEAEGATVLLTRTGNDDDVNDDPSLSARVAFANANNADWFHSIHSNATGWPLGDNTTVNRTLMLVREEIVPGGDPVYGPGTGQPEWPEAWDMSALIGPRIVSMLRTQSWSRALDYTFYGTYTLGVLRGLTMPGELSEGSFHDNFAETYRLMNNDYRKMEAYAIRNSFMEYFSVPSDTLAIIAGIVRDPATGPAPINFLNVRLAPFDSIYSGDRFNNGFYMFDQLPAGTYDLIFDTPFYIEDTVTVTLSAGEIRFLDGYLVLWANPTITTSIPVDGDTSFPASSPIILNFTKPMNTASVEGAFSFSPPIAGTFSWANSNSQLRFTPDSLFAFYQTYTLTIDTSAYSESGQQIDGNGDTTPGDPFQLSFTTRAVPLVTATFPANNDTVYSPDHVIHISFNEKIDPFSINSINIAVRVVGGAVISKGLEYHPGAQRDGANVYVTGGLIPGKGYLVRVSDVKNVHGDPMPYPLVFQFSVGPQSYLHTPVETFDASLSGNWLQPSAGDSTVGLTSGSFGRDSTKSLGIIPSNGGSGKLSFQWDTTAGNWLLQESLVGGAPYAVTWQKRYSRLQVYVLGDGSGTLFRFAVDDSVDAFPSGTPTNREVSEWIPIDWVGWQLVEWDLENGPVGSWVGNGVLEGDLRFNSLQLSYAPGSSASSGEIRFDQLQVGVDAITSVEQTDVSELPETFALEQNYPNPFNPSTIIRYVIPKEGHVRLVVYDNLGREVLKAVDQQQTAGTYAVTLNAASLGSGVYYYRLVSGGFTQTRKMVVIK